MGIDFNENIDEGTRIFKQFVDIGCFRTYRKKIYWSPMVYKNGLIVYGKNIEKYTDFLTVWINNSKKHINTTDIHLYDFFKTTDEKTEEYIQELSQKTKNLHYTKKQNFENIIHEIYQYRNKIKEKTDKRHMIEPTDKKLTFFFLRISDREITTILINKQLRQELMILIKEAYYQRIYLFILTTSAESLPKKIIESFDWCVFLDKPNMDILQRIYSDMMTNRISKRQELIGLSYDIFNKFLLTVNNWKFTPTEGFYKENEQFKKEDDDYQKFLESLPQKPM